MTLDEYLRASSDTAEALADRCDITEASISRIRKGKQNVTLDLAMLIVRETKGMVQLSDLAECREKAA